MRTRPDGRNFLGVHPSDALETYATVEFLGIDSMLLSFILGPALVVNT